MSKISIEARIVAALMLYVMVILLLGACGGGSSGTDGGVVTKRLGGVVRDSAGVPLAQFEVTLLETGDSGRTDSDGRFLIEAALQESSFTLLVEGTEFSASSSLMLEVPGDRAAEIELEADTENNVLFLISATVSERSQGADGVESQMSDAGLAERGKDKGQDKGEDKDEDKNKDKVQDDSKGREVPAVPADPMDVVTETQIIGVVVSSTGAPVANARVAVDPGSSSTLTDQSGRFSILSDEFPAKFEISVEIGAATGAVNLGDLASRPLLIELTIVVQSGSGSDTPIDQDPADSTTTDSSELDLMLGDVSVSRRR